MMKLLLRAAKLSHKSELRRGPVAQLCPRRVAAEKII